MIIEKRLGFVKSAEKNLFKVLKIKNNYNESL
jgi:hypothetical protein